MIGGRLHLGLGHAGEIGHTTVDPDGPLCGCGNRGCLDRMAAPTRSPRAAGQPTVAAAAEAARTGDAVARAAFARAGEYVGRVLAGAVVLLWPERVVVGGGVADAGELLLEPLRAELRRRASVAPIDEIAGRARQAGSARGRRRRRAVERRGQPGRARVTRGLPGGTVARVLEAADEHRADRPDRPEVAGAGERPDRDEQDRERDHRRHARDTAPPARRAWPRAGRRRAARDRRACGPRRPGRDAASSSSGSSRPAAACVRSASATCSRSASEARRRGARVPGPCPVS